MRWNSAMTSRISILVQAFVLFLYVTSISRYFHCFGMSNNETEDEIRNTSVYNRMERDSEGIWPCLTLTAKEVFRFQNNHSERTSFYTSQTQVVVFLLHHSAWRSAKELEASISEVYNEMKFLLFEVDEDEEFGVGLSPILKQLRNYNNMNSVILLSENNSFTMEILRFFSTNMDFRWTSLLHTTEWIIIGSPSGLFSNLQVEKLKIDFLTLIFSNDSNFILIAQKSRRHDLELIFQLPYRNNESANFECASQQFLCCLKSVEFDGKLRQNALRFLETQKSTLEGLHLPVSVTPDRQSVIYKVVDGNITYYKGLSISLLDALQFRLGFTYELVWALDGGFYGEVKDDGNATGIVGHLARRETAMTTMPLSWIENREQAVDFVPAPIAMRKSISIIYRLPAAGEKLDTTFIDIVRPEFILLCLGPLLILVIIGAVVHIFTKSCTATAPIRLSSFSRKEMRSLYSFPAHICFHINGVYASQTGRILRASWGLFCVILSAAYSAHLVTTFTIKPEELSIKNFGELLDNTDFSFGTSRSNSAFMTTLKTSKNLQEIWKKMVEFNETNPQTFTPNLKIHVERVLAGGYAWLYAMSFEEMKALIDADYTSVRMYPQQSLDRVSFAYIGVPKNTFYIDELYHSMLELEASGILYKIKISNDYIEPESLSSGDTVESKVTERQPLSFGKIKLLIFVTSGGIGLGAFVLFLETALVICKKCVAISRAGRR